MSQNPEEGRISPENYEVLLRDAHRKTVDMRREYRSERTIFENKQKMKRWTARHRTAHSDIDVEMGTISRQQGPQNRRTRRKYAKRMNVFKVDGEWQRFSEMYKRRFGHQMSISRKKISKGNIAEAMKAGE